MARRLRTLFGLSLLALGSGTARAAADPAPPAPSAELLLFLAEFHDASGEPVDPVDLDQRPAPKAAAEESDPKQRRARTKSDKDETEPPPPK